MELTRAADRVVIVGMTRSALRPTTALALVLACGPQPAETGGTTEVDVPDTTGTLPAECPAEPPAVVDADDFARQMGAEVCAKARACGCPNVAAGCEDRVAAAWKMPIDNAVGPELAFDASCAATVVQDFAWETCALDQATAPCPVCPYVHGVRQKGESCDPIGSFSTCDGPLFCVNGTCTDVVPPIVAVGAACWDVKAGLSLGRCEADATCDTDAGTCVALPAAGEPCHYGTCASAAYCSYDDVPSGVCVTRAPGGVGCGEDRECASRVCLDGACRDAAWVCRLAG